MLSSQQSETDQVTEWAHAGPSSLPVVTPDPKQDEMLRMADLQTADWGWGLHQSSLSALKWYDQLAVARYHRWPRLGLSRKTLWTYGQASVQRALQTHQLRVSSLGWTGGFTGSAGFSYKEAVLDAWQALQEARALHAEVLLIAPGALSGHIRKHALRLLCEGLKELCERSGQSEIRLAVWCQCRPVARDWSFLQCVELLEAVLEQSPSRIGWAAHMHDAMHLLPQLSPHLRERLFLVAIPMPQHLEHPEQLRTHLEHLLPLRSWVTDATVWEYRDVCECLLSSAHTTSCQTYQRRRSRQLSRWLGLPQRTRPLATIDHHPPSD
ncbi:MAG: hypothetical protein KatS3mg113_0172 [Planctomycetaceae bacterium]|nr:MAG: hypothetical protein KatS3mg113_0172 [Planctomycetaceae bacterium]